MFFRPAMYRHPEFRAGVRDFQRLAPGIAAWGLMTGVAMVKSGMGLGESLLMAVVVFAGSSQLAATPLIIAGAPAWIILATAFCVNLRFVVFSLHLRSYFAHLPTWERMTHGYFTADMNYVLFIGRFPHPAVDAEGRLAQEAYMSGNGFFNWIVWVTTSVLGVVLANQVPQAWGLGFAGILCLIGIMCSLATTRLRLCSAVVAGSVGVAAYALPLRLNIIAAIGAAVLLCMTLEKFQPTLRRERQA
ncbi:MAG: AzlC family ABC transporter permease [Burkholderiaceae bacterium]